MKKIAIIHFNNFEFYPPTINLLNLLEKLGYPRTRILLITNNSEKIKAVHTYSIIKIKKIITIKKKNRRIIRLIKYIYFNLYTIIKLLYFHPSVILYYETHSSFPIYIYKKYLNKKVDVYIHYHEYMTDDEYKTGMFLLNFYHNLEKKLYADAIWISLVNPFLVNRFITDNRISQKNKVHSLPNFPPRDWAARTLDRIKIEKPVKLVYVGSLSNETMFYKEIAEWLLALNGKVSLDIYSQRITSDLVEHIKSCNNNILDYKGFVNYNDLPRILSKYDVGLILYRGHVPNFIYTTTNKLFEYLACGLDVWFPEEILGIYDYITQGTYPKVIKIDYKHLDKYDLDELISHDGLKYKPSTYFAEDVYEPFIKNYLLK